MIQFIAASHNEDILKNNLLKSILFADYKLIIQRGFDNVSKAYNQAPITGNIIVYLHHDIYLPGDFYSNLQSSIQAVNKIDNNWGVLGLAGVKLIDGKREIFGNINDRGRQWGNPDNLPAEVDTLDELVLVTHGDFVFDENLPTDFYGADICLQSKLQGRKNYAVNAYCYHNSTRAFGGRTESFYECEKYFKEKWKNELPIATTCAIIQ